MPGQNLECQQIQIDRNRTSAIQWKRNHDYNFVQPKKKKKQATSGIHIAAGDMKGLIEKGGKDNNPHQLTILWGHVFFLFFINPKRTLLKLYGGGAFFMFLMKCQQKLFLFFKI